MASPRATLPAMIVDAFSALLLTVLGTLLPT
jgi:hypothetical protein